MSVIDDALLADLRRALGANAEPGEAVTRHLHRRDASMFVGDGPLAVCYPTSTSQVSAIV